MDVEVLAAALGEPLVGELGRSIERSALRCLNTQGVDYWGRNFSKIVAIEAREVGVLWFIVNIPKNVPNDAKADSNDTIKESNQNLEVAENNENGWQSVDVKDDKVSK